MEEDPGLDIDISHFGVEPQEPLLNSAQAAARLKKKPAAPRLQHGTACLRCRKRKVRCDGGNPCAFCVARNGVCEYNHPASPPPTPAAPMLITHVVPTARELTRSTNVMDAFRRVHYVQMYQRHFHVFLPVLDVSTNYTLGAGFARTVSQQLQETVAMTISARALGQMDIANNLFTEARQISQFCEYSGDEGTLAGIFMMGVFHLGEDDNLAHEYLLNAERLALEFEPSPKTRTLRGLIERLNNSVRSTDAAQLIEKSPQAILRATTRAKSNTRPELFSPAKHPLPLELVRHFLRFPIHCEAIDIFASRWSLDRVPEEERHNTPMTGDRVHLMLQCMKLGEMSLPEMAAMETAPIAGNSTDVRTRVLQRYCMSWGMRMLLCTAGGLVRLGCHYVRLALDSIQAFTSTNAGFNYPCLIAVGIGVVSFVTTYREHLKAEGYEWRSVLMELHDSISIIKQFSIARQLIDVCRRALSDGLRAAVSPSPDDASVSAHWMAPEQAPMGGDRFLSIVRERHTSKTMLTGPPVAAMDIARAPQFHSLTEPIAFPPPVSQWLTGQQKQDIDGGSVTFQMVFLPPTALLKMAPFSSAVIEGEDAESAAAAPPVRQVYTTRRITDADRLLPSATDMMDTTTPMTGTQPETDAALDASSMFPADDAFDPDAMFTELFGAVASGAHTEAYSMDDELV